MTTKAEGFRYRQERSGSKKAKRAGHQGRAPSAEGLLGRRDRSKSAARSSHQRRRMGRAGDR